MPEPLDAPVDELNLRGGDLVEHALDEVGVEDLEVRVRRAAAGAKPNVAGFAAGAGAGAPNGSLLGAFDGMGG